MKSILEMLVGVAMDENVLLRQGAAYRPTSVVRARGAEGCESTVFQKGAVRCDYISGL
jgi:hypothetical protein